MLEIQIDKLEDEIKLKPDNGFVKIIDENINGTKSYSDLIREECFYWIKNLCKNNFQKNEWFYILSYFTY